MFSVMTEPHLSIGCSIVKGSCKIMQISAPRSFARSFGDISSRLLPR